MTSMYDVAYKYKDGEKTVWATVGKAFTESDESITLKMTSMPIQERWDYKLYLFPREE